jgi:Type II CAAX prenyl endopeptidase Rce1-like
MPAPVAHSTRSSRRSRSQLAATMTARTSSGDRPSGGCQCLLGVDRTERAGWLESNDPGPLGEELGWRGFALPELLKNRSPWLAGLMLGVIWGIWHLPAFFVAGFTQSSISIPVFMISIVALSTLMAWVFKGTHGSLLLAVLGHAMFNLCMDLGTMPLASAVMLVMAALAVEMMNHRMRHLGAKQPALGRWSPQ